MMIGLVLVQFLGIWGYLHLGRVYDMGLCQNKGKLRTMAVSFF